MDTNLALFGADSVTAEGGQLVLSLPPAPEGTVDSTSAPKTFRRGPVERQAHLRSCSSTGPFRGRFRGRLVVGHDLHALAGDDWNELDIEVLGQAPVSTQFNAMVYSGPPVTPPVTQSVMPTLPHKKVDLGFDPSADFHVYEIEWTPRARASSSTIRWCTPGRKRSSV